jgi:hypothetical protein
MVLAGVLFLAALVAGAVTLMPWRDFGRRFGGTVSATGWVSADGSTARGWVVVLLAVLLAVAGILIASGRVGRGRVLASATGAGLVLAAVVEWGLGVGSVRSGPGLGLWVVFATGLLVIVAVGVLDSRPRVVV